MVDLRVNRIDKFTSGIADIKIARHPLKKDVIVVFNHVEFDIYQDSQTVEECRVNKKAIVKKDPDMSYVQEMLGDNLLEDTDKIPWEVTLTLTNLPRVPKMDDRIICDNIIYTIHKVKPINRNVRSVITLYIYPERTDDDEELKINRVQAYFETQPIESIYDYVNQEVILEVTYSGFPQLYSLDNVKWYTFDGNIRLYVETDEELTLFLKEDDNIAEYKL